MPALQLLPYALFLTALLASSAAGHAAASLRAHLTHVDSGRGFTKHQLLRRMAARSLARIDSRCPAPGRGANAHPVTAPVSRGTVGIENMQSEYLVHFGIGTPRPQRVALTLDTGSDFVWTQCFCQVCFPQPFPAINISASGTIHGVSCSDPVCSQGGLALSGCTARDNICFYTYFYGDNSITTGQIVEDTFTFQQAPNDGKVAAVPKLRFGCGMFNTGLFGSNESGIAGFGRGPLSLPSQLKVGGFSYCFTNIVESRTSPVFLGTPDDLQAQATGPIQSTPFARGPDSTKYYLSLKGITVGKTRLPFNASTFAFKGDGSGGTMIDSGLSITKFPRAVFLSIVEEFKAQVPLPSDMVAGMLCFSAPHKKKAPAMPKMTLHLEDADWDLPRENYVLDLDGGDGDDDGTCVVIHAAGESGMTGIGNFQQQNTHVVYDLESNKLVFVPARCDKL
ncbi:hypothetical protein CFC21_068867 [Triticum aestivum]|uniref:Peptidase A1 domain-containing protein n=3 Tax=Triticum TaxID=4564 RepID=A0A9R0U2Y1_TRITD|nr:aspartic proteinase nepenthesin-1-like [Triticum dicoccoides]XP_044383960.1 aspartic proteinase nepenthesin-1-like [Triticum aestivum]KAF7062242.1 hypothetical protein CFC21_068867 [Triticum aestivum]VAI24868.1 unnamed protein product [Triticum turgidum subsp. durum]